MAIIATHYKSDRERTIGMMESASGVGLLIGPFFGAILYQVGGYVLPFFATGNHPFFNPLAIVYLCLYPLIAYSLNEISNLEKFSPYK